ncbi:uncharacterized protein LOC120339798 isoform X2 [Styela clava]
MEDTNIFIQAIEGYEEKQDPLSEELDRFITYIARTGDILGPWEKVQKVFMKKLTSVLDEFYNMAPYKVGKINANATNDDFDEMKKRLLQLTEEFDSPPFTIQRLCELLAEPRKNYTKCDKFMRGIEKNLMVVSSWSNLPRTLSDSNDNNMMVNGVDSMPGNGYTPGSDRFKPHWSNLPPSPISTTPPKIPGVPDFTAVTLPKLEITTGETGESTIEDETKTAVSETPASEERTEQTETTPEMVTEETENTQKPNVSATIISSSPPKTVNIKRKIEDANDESTTKTDKGITDTQIAESPTKKLKSDTVLEQVQSTAGEDSKSADSESHDSAKIESSELVTKDDSTETTTGDSTKMESSESITDSAETEKDDSSKTVSSGLPETNVDQNIPPTQTLTLEPGNTDNTENADKDIGTSVDPPSGTEKKSDDEVQMEVD